MPLPEEPRWNGFRQEPGKPKGYLGKQSSPQSQARHPHLPLKYLRAPKAPLSGRHPQSEQVWGEHGRTLLSCCYLTHFHGPPPHR